MAGKHSQKELSPKIGQSLLPEILSQPCFLANMHIDEGSFPFQQRGIYIQCPVKLRYI